MRRELLFLLPALASACAGLNRRDPASTSVQRGDYTAARSAKDARDTGAGIRVTTFNVHGEPPARIARVLQRSRVLRDADVVFLQELETQTAGPESSPRKIAEQLRMSFAYAPGYGLGEEGSHGVAILSRFPLSEVTLIELPRYSVHFNSARRVALGATVRIGEAAVRLYSVHLDNRINPSDRRAQLEPVVEDALQQPVTRVIIGGDFNTSPFCWISHAIPVPCGLQTKRLEGYVRKHGFDTPVTASGGTAKWLAMRLDGIYTRGVTVVDYGVEDAIRISDHLPLWLEARL
jgi:endonuclease/exonuclease/phosphatase family metal-dependent hydrolase